MTEAEVTEAARILDAHGIRFVVVGGQAIGRSITTTDDVDVMVSTSDYSVAVRKLQTDGDLRFEWDEEGVTRFRMRSMHEVPLDVLDAKNFAGDRSGEEFFEFLAEEDSQEREGIRYASQPAVWYTRLMVRSWKTYAEKTLRNMLGGAGAGQLREVEGIARRFGTDAVIRDRLTYVQSELKRPDLEYILRDE